MIGDPGVIAAAAFCKFWRSHDGLRLMFDEQVARLIFETGFCLGALRQLDSDDEKIAAIAKATAPQPEGRDER